MRWFHTANDEMRDLENYVLPLLGISIILLGMYRCLMGVGCPGFEVSQIILVSAGIAITIIGLKFEIQPISFLKNLCITSGRTIVYVLAISVALYFFMDVLLGRVYPKVYTPTKYGWTVSADSEVKKKIQDTKGNYRKVTNRYFAHGFKRWPKNYEGKSRVLVIGDSFTMMRYVSNGEEWYAYLEREFPDIAFYVFGGGGYGTLQEYMVMDDYFDEISPQAIIWQFCGNDYANNYYELDRQSYPFNNHAVRPYLENEEIVYRLPLPYSTLRKISFSADQLLHLYDGKRRRDAGDLQKIRKDRKKRRDSMTPLEKKAEELKQSKAIDVTKALIKKVRLRAEHIPIYFFNVSPFSKADLSVCKTGDFRCIDFIGNYMKRLEDAGIQIMAENTGHWNFEGNKYAGKRLAKYFKNNGGIIPKKGIVRTAQ